MISEDDGKTILRAALYYHEMFKKTLLLSTPPGVSTKTQMDLLVTLYELGPMSMSELSASVGIAPEQATRALKSLRERGLVESERSPENRRMVIARLSETGILVFDEHTRIMRANLQAAIDGLSEEEIAELVKTSEKATALLRKTSIKHIVAEPHVAK